MNALEIIQQLEAIRLVIAHQPREKIDAARIRDYLNRANSYAVSYCPGLLGTIGEARQMIDAHSPLNTPTHGDERP